MNKRVLIITYYWPPSGGSGVQRWLKFVKYLVRSGWEPYVFTPENPSFTIQDTSLQQDVPKSVEVIRFPIWEPYQVFTKISSFLGRKNLQQTDYITSGKKSLFQKVSSWIRGNMFIPDARIFWVKPSVEYLIDFVQRHDIHRIITTGPPHSVHLIGLRLKKLNPALRWVADFRDPWSEWDLLDAFSLSAWARKRHVRLEHSVLTRADRVITIAPFHVSRFEILGGRPVDLITNGFDEEDFMAVKPIRTTRFTIRHMGMVDALRNPKPFLLVLKSMCTDDRELAKQIKIEFIGKVNSEFREFINQDSLLSSITEFLDHLPHDHLLNLYGSTDLQLLVLAQTQLAPGNLPGKFFEYLASGKPILALGPCDGDAAQILAETQAGTINEPNDEVGIRRNLLQYYNQWKNQLPASGRKVEVYSRRVLTDKLIAILHEL